MVTCTTKFGCICYHTLGKIVMFCIIGNVNPNFFQIYLVLLHPSKWNEKHIIFQMRGREPKGKKWRNDFLLYFANVKFTFILHHDCVRRLYITGKDQIFADFSRNSILFFCESAWLGWYAVMILLWSRLCPLPPPILMPLTDKGQCSKIRKRPPGQKGVSR